MPASNPASSQRHVLSATYASPTNPPFSHIQELPAPATTSTSDRTTYLGALRKATSDLQEVINKELTQRMEDDKTKAVTIGAGKMTGAIDEAKEEDNYGEEVPEDED